MKRVFWLAVPLTVAFIAALLAANLRTGERILTFDGLGAVQLGMTVAEAETALGAKFFPMEPDNGVDSEACWITSRADNTDLGVTYRVEYGKITRIYVYSHIGDGEEPPIVPSVVTERGIGIDASTNEVNDAYGPDLVVKFHSQGDEGDYSHLYMKVLSSDGRSGHVFVTGDNRVIEIGSSTPGSIDAEEGCL